MCITRGQTARRSSWFVRVYVCVCVGCVCCTLKYKVTLPISTKRKLRMRVWHLVGKTENQFILTSVVTVKHSGWIVLCNCITAFEKLVTASPLNTGADVLSPTYMWHSLTAWAELHMSNLPKSPTAEGWRWHTPAERERRERSHKDQTLSKNQKLSPGVWIPYVPLISAESN